MHRFGKLILEKVTILTPATEAELVIMNTYPIYLGTTYNTYISTDRGTAM